MAAITGSCVMILAKCCTVASHRFCAAAELKLQLFNVPEANSAHEQTSQLPMAQTTTPDCQQS